MKKLHIDISRCTGCRSCEIACAIEHSQSKDIIQAMGEMPLPKKRIKVADTLKKYLPLFCRKCEEPRCADACISGALKKENGTVAFDETRCVGCWSCILACPYSAILRRRDYEKIAVCDLCKDRLQGKRACEEACPTKCVFYGEEKEFEDILKGRENA